MFQNETYSPGFFEHEELMCGVRQGLRIDLIDHMPLQRMACFDGWMVELAG